MGNQLSGIVPSQILPIESYLTDLNNKYQDILYDSSLGNTRLLKVIKAKTEEGPIVVKVFVIHDSSLALTQYKKQLDDVNNKLHDAPNCLTFHYSELTERAGFMVRQYMKSSLYDRISTRPFLTCIEKKWIAFQILSALKQTHEKNVCHGDIKLENIFVTSWSWVMLTDFATYKPVLLPEDNPANYTYFFDTSAKRVCYIAPERFLKTCHREEEQLWVLKDLKDKDSPTPSMDIFATGCVLAELFTEGIVPFDLTQLLRFRTGNYYPSKVLDKIQDERIKGLIEHMISKDPSARLSAECYLEQEKGLAFPENFYSLFWPFMKQFSSLPSMSPDARIKRIKILLPEILSALLPQENREGYDDDESSCPYQASRKSESLVIIVSLITSSIRSLTLLNSKLMTLELLRTISPYCFDGVILDRILPFVLYLLHYGEARVRADAISTLSHCLTLVSDVPRSDVNIFPEYIFPNINDVPHDEAIQVRMAFAQHIGTIADTALRFLEYGHLQDMVPNFENEMSSFHKVIQQKVASLFSDPSNLVKRTLIEHSAIKLCIFFGRQKANDIILSHMITFLNEKRDPHLRLSFFKNIVGVASCIGFHCANILQPLLLQGLSDTEEAVIIAAVTAMGSLTEVGLFSHQLLFELLRDTIPLLIHPNTWIRQAVVGLIVKVSKILPFVAVLTVIKKLSEPYLSQDIIQFDKEGCIMASLSPQVPRELYDTLVKSPNVEIIIKILYDAVKQQRPLDSLSSALLDVDAQTRNLVRRLSGAGLNDDNVKFIFKLKDHLIRLQRHKKTAESSHSHKQPILGTLNFNADARWTALPSHHYRLTNDDTLDMPAISSSSQGSAMSPNQTMNEEWQTMFGNSVVQVRNVSSPPRDRRSSSPLRTEVTTSDSSSLTSKNEENSMSECVSECQKDLEHILASKREELISKLQQKRALASSLSEGVPFPPKWRPKGNLIAHLHEHKGAIHRLIHLKGKPSCFASCSSDGTLKIWDCNKTERKFPIIKSKFTYIKQGGVLTSLASCYGSDLLASASKNGSIHILRVDKQILLTSRHLDKETEGHAVDINFMDSGSQSVLTYATIYGELFGWDIRSPTIAWKLNNEAKRGLITSYVIDNTQNWLAVGTTRGFHVCWDLRFRLPISHIQHPRESIVRRIKIHPNQPSWIVSALTDNNEVAFFDIETHSRVRTLWASAERPLYPQSSKTPYSVSGLALGQTESGDSFVVTGGQDCILRFWDMQEPQASFYIADSAHRSSRCSSVEYALKVVDESEVIIESTSTKTTPLHSMSDDSPYRGAEQAPMGHKDTITDVLLVTNPQRLIVSSAYDGTIKIWK